MSSVINLQAHKKEKAMAELTKSLSEVSALADTLEAYDENLKSMVTARGGVMLTKAQYLDLKLKNLELAVKDKEFVQLAEKYKTVCADRVVDLSKNTKFLQLAVLTCTGVGICVGLSLGLLLR